MSKTAVTGGMTRGPASPTRTMAAASAQVGAVDGASPMMTRPPVISVRPPAISSRAPSLSASRALTGVRAAPTSIIGRNAAPVASGDRPRNCWRYRLITNGSP